MTTYKYPFLAKLFYRYANIPATILLLIHLISSIMMIPDQPSFMLPASINALVIFVLNRFYYKIYKHFPFTVEIDNEKMICSNFMYSTRKVEIMISNIDEIKGGTFSGHITRPVYIHDATQNVTLGFYHHLKNYNKFITTILSNVDKKLYDQLLERMKEIGDLNKMKRNKRARK